MLATPTSLMAKTFYQQVTSGFNPSSTIACRPGFGAAASSCKHTAECLLWVISCRGAVKLECPLYPGQLNRSTQHFIVEGKDRL